MVKESTTQVKKKRKTVSAETEQEPDIYQVIMRFSNTGISEYPITNHVKFQKVCELEEKEAKSRDIVQDSKIFFNVLQDIPNFMAQARDLKLSQKEVFIQALYYL